MTPDPPTHPPASTSWPYLYVVVAPLVLFAPFLLGHQVLYWGTPLLQFYPWRKFALDTIRDGYLPLWNPYLGNGAPLIANHQSAIFYPPNWLSLLMPLDQTLNWLAALHLVWAGVGMVTLARAVGLRPLGQAVAGLGWGLSQYLVARVGFVSINATAAWLPWVIWAGEQIASPKPQIPNLQSAAAVQASNLHQVRLKSALLLSLFLSLQLLAGHAQTAWYTLLLLGAWTLWRSLTHAPPHTPTPPHTRILHASSFVLLACALAPALAALQLLPTAELVRESPRATSADYDFVVTYSFSPWRLLTLFAPDLLGNPARGQYYGYGNYWEDAVYVGILPTILAIGVVLQPIFSTVRDLRQQSPRRPVTISSLRPVTPALTRHRTSTLAYFLILLLLSALVLALGRNTPVFPFFYRHVPTFNVFQAPARIMIWFVFALALLAGLGADLWQSPRGRALYWTRLGAAGAVSAAAVGALAVTLLPSTGRLADQLRTVAQAVALAGVGVLLSAVLSLLKPRTDTEAPIAKQPSGAHSSSAGRWELAVALFLAADLIMAGYGLNPGAPPDLYRRPAASSALLANAAEGHRLFRFPDDEQRIKFRRYFSFQHFGALRDARAVREAQLPNVALLDGLASANNFDPLVSARYAGLIEVISTTRSLGLLRLMDVAVLASSESLPLDADEISVGDATTFYRLPGDARRVRVVYQAQVVADAGAARAALADPNFDPEAEVILEAHEAGPSAQGSVPREDPKPARTAGVIELSALTSPRDDAFLTATPNTVTIAVSLSRPGWVVLSDTYYPGWVVEVDGQAAPLLHADYAFRAVAVEPGAHQVTFRYQPRSFQVGLWISGVGGLVWIGVALWLWRRTHA